MQTDTDPTPDKPASAPATAPPDAQPATQPDTPAAAPSVSSPITPPAEPHAPPTVPPRRHASLSFMFSHPLHIVSLGFGSGLSPVMPGTAGTLFAWASFYLLDRYLHPGVAVWGALILGGFAAGIPLTGFTAKKMGTDDPSPVVWDEIVAFWLVLLMVMPVGVTGQLIAFVLFRFFDMVKPPPIRYFDRTFKGGFGIMFDDIVAAIFALLVIALWRVSG